MLFRFIRAELIKLRRSFISVSYTHLIRILIDEVAGCKDTELIVVCGSNQPLYEELHKNAAPNVTVLGFTSNMAEYMKAADLFVTKPGGLSTTEAAVCGFPIVHTAAIPGCETDLSLIHIFHEPVLSGHIPNHRIDLILLQQIHDLFHVCRIERPCLPAFQRHFRRAGWCLPVLVDDCLLYTSSNPHARILAIASS